MTDLRQGWRYQVEAWREPLRLVCVEVPEPSGTQVLVRVELCGVCHSDLHIWHGPRPGSAPRPLPITMGHEVFGVVEAVGPDVRDVKPGDRRIVFPWIGCGACDACLRDDEVNCPAPATLGIARPGGYASHVVVPHPRYLVAPGPVPAETAATMACSGLTAFSAIRKLPAVSASDLIVIIGAGGVGLAAVGLARLLLPARIAVAEISPEKRAAAMESGADLTFDPTVPEEVAALASSCIAVLDFVGSPQTVAAAVGMVRKGGTVVLVGLQGGEAQLKLETLPYKNMRICGSMTGSLAELRELVSLASLGSLRFVPTKRVPIADINQALDDLEHGRAVGRIVTSTI